MNKLSGPEALVELMLDTSQKFLFRDETATWLLKKSLGNFTNGKRNELHNVHIWCESGEHADQIVKDLLSKESVVLRSRSGITSSTQFDVIELTVGGENASLMISVWGVPKAHYVKIEGAQYGVVHPVVLCGDLIAMLSSDKVIRHPSALYALYNALFVSEFTIQDLLNSESRNIWQFSVFNNFLSEEFMQKYNSLAKSRKWPPYSAVSTMVLMFMVPIVSVACGRNISSKTLLWRNGCWVGSQVTL